MRIPDRPKLTEDECKRIQEGWKRAAENLRKLREKAGLSQEELVMRARRAYPGVSEKMHRNYVGNFERGKVPMHTSIGYVYALARVLNVAVTDIYNGAY